MCRWQGKRLLAAHCACGWVKCRSSRWSICWGLSWPSISSLRRPARLLHHRSKEIYMALLTQSRSKVGYSTPKSLRVFEVWQHLKNNPWGIGVREILGALGPGFLVSVGYMDPGNWGTNLAAGAGFGYQLLWVILVSNIVAIFLQISSAKLGIATGKDLAHLIREQFSRPVVVFMGVTTALAMMATDLAEVLGGALGFNILFHIPLFISAIITGGIVMGLLALSRWGFRKVEFVIIGLVSIIGLAYVYETVLVHPIWHQD